MPYFSIIQGNTTSHGMVEKSGAQAEQGTTTTEPTEKTENEGTKTERVGSDDSGSRSHQKRKWSSNRESSDELSHEKGHSRSRLKRNRISISGEHSEKRNLSPENESRGSRRKVSESASLSRKEARAKRFGLQEEKRTRMPKYDYLIRQSRYPCNAASPVDRNKPNWGSTHLQYSSLAKKSGRKIILAGDSMVKGLTRYPRVWRSYFASLGALNFGIGGDRTQHVLWRLQNGEMECTPEIVVIHCGTNNINQDMAEDIVRGLLAIVDFISTKTPDTRIIITGILPRDRFPSFRRTKITEVNSILEEIIDLSDHQKFDNVYFLRPDSDWVLDDGTIDESLYHTDYLHLIEAGDEKFAKAIVSLIKKVRNAKII